MLALLASATQFSFAKLPSKQSRVAAPHQALLFVGGGRNHELGLVACADDQTHEWLAPESCAIPKQVSLTLATGPTRGTAAMVLAPVSPESPFPAKLKTPGVKVAANTDASTVATASTDNQSRFIGTQPGGPDYTVEELRQLFIKTKTTFGDQTRIRLQSIGTADGELNQKDVHVSYMNANVVGRTILAVRFNAEPLQALAIGVGPWTNFVFCHSTDADMGGWAVVGVSDLNADGSPEYLLRYERAGYTILVDRTGAIVGKAWGEMSCG